MTTRGTSFAAARSVRGKSGAQRARVFLCILRRGTKGATLEEIEQELGLPGNTVRPRRVELEGLGFVQDSGTRRPTSSGKMAIVWSIPTHIAIKAAKKLHDKGFDL
jgi:predicted ArsR family transcriptional regulator